MGTWLAIVLALALFAALTAFLLLRDRLNDRKTPVARGLLDSDPRATILAVWAHPDDEITCAGALARMTRAGARLRLLYLTAGEAARDTGYDRQTLADVRRKEAQAAGDLLGAEAVEVLDFPDGGLNQVDADKVKQALRSRIDACRPSLLITFDERVGFYGHPDHVRTGRWVREVFEEGARTSGFPVRRLYQVTLPLRLIALALRLVAAFRDNYPADPERGLPAPTVAVNISAVASIKRRLLDVHASQRRVIADVQPYYDRVPAWLYYRLFDREYFTLAGSA